MSKTKSFVEKHQAKLEEQEAFNESYLRLMAFKFAKERETELQTLSDDERQSKEIELVSRDEKKLAEIKTKLEKKLDNKRIRYYKKETVNQRRIWEIDFLRGLIIVGMLIDHFFYDFVGIFTPSNFNNLPQFMIELGNFSVAYWVNVVRITFRLIGVCGLVFLSGVSSKLSKNPIRRSLLIIGVGLIMSGVFAIVANVTGEMNDLVFMGAVMGIGVCLLIYSLYKLAFSRFKKIYKWLTLGLAIAMLIGWGFISYNNATDKSNFWFLYNGFYGAIPKAFWPDIPANLPSIFVGLTYFGSDWLGLFPSLGYMFLGGFVGELLYQNPRPLFAKSNEKLNRITKVFVVPGRNSVWFYLLHQLIYIIIIGAVALIMGATLNF